MRLDWTLSIGTLIHLGALLIAIIGLYYKLEKRITVLETKMELLIDGLRLRPATED